MMRSLTEQIVGVKLVTTNGALELPPPDAKLLELLTTWKLGPASNTSGACVPCTMVKLRSTEEARS